MDFVVHLSQLERHAVKTGAGKGGVGKPGVLLIPSQFVSSVEVDVSQVPKRYVRQALPALVEDEVAEPVDELLLCPGQVEEGRLLVLVVRQSKVAEWLDRARISGVEPHAIYPDFYLVPQGEQGVAQGAAGNDYQILRLGAHGGSSGTEAQMAALASALCPAQVASGPSAIKLDLTRPVLPVSQAQPPISLLPAEWQQKTGSRGLSRMAWRGLSLVSLVLLTGLLNLWSWQDYYREQNALLEQQLRHGYGALLPNSGADNLALNRRILQRRLDDATQPFMDLPARLTAASALMERCHGCYLESFSINDDGFVIGLGGENVQAVLRAANSLPVLKLDGQQTGNGISTLQFSMTREK